MNPIPKFSISLIALMVACNMPMTWSQERLAERGINPTTHTGMPRYVQDEVIVKFNAGTSHGSARSISEVGVDKVLAAFDVKEMEQLLPDNHPGRTMRSAPAYTGERVTEVDLSSLYLLKVNMKEDQNLGQILSELKGLPEVEYAEPNYLYYTCGVADEYTAEPMYKQQWGIPRVKLDKLWAMPVVTNKRPVIAIIDTGVDVTHPDLAPNIWTNEGEIPGDGLDNDNNGYVDDVHGWDFVNNSGKIVDGFGHGTHCAGIAAASGINKLGITGANPDALIMPVAVLQSNGSGDMASIAKGIRYAVDNGATIISMSFGSTDNAIAMQQTLQQAYQSAILVAAAGNESLGIDAACSPEGKPLFPGGYSFVLGVMATQETKGTNGYRTSFSNFDCDGPVKSSFPDGQGYNYELSAPGAKILSTVPGGQYQSWNGTSMATPLVAGGISRLLQVSDYSTQEKLWADLIHTSGDNVDFMACYEISERHPVLNISSVTLDDEGGDGDNSPDAGEVIDIYPKVLNTGGVAVDIRMKIEFAEFEDTTVVELLDSVVDFGYSLSTYEKRQSANPLRIRMSKDLTNNRNVCMMVSVWYGDHKGTASEEIVLTSERGVELRGMLTEDLTLTADQKYIVTDNLGVPEGVTLTIKPGTVVQFKDGAKLSCAGSLKAEGTPDSMIVFTKEDTGNVWAGLEYTAADTLKYCVLEWMGYFGTVHIHNCENCIVRKIGGSSVSFEGSYFGRSNFLTNDILGVNMTGATLISSNFMENQLINATPLFAIDALKKGKFTLSNSNVFSNTITDYSPYTGLCSFYSEASLPFIYTNPLPNYHGSSLDSLAHTEIFDFGTSLSGVFGLYDLSNKLDRPSAEAHGMVWKVVVDGNEIRDNLDVLPPLGVGKHTFEVYFNRPMNKRFAPKVAMGIRSPSSSQKIDEEGFWNEEGTVYSVCYTMKRATDGDGLNGLSISDAKDNESFELPMENRRFSVVLQAAGLLSAGFEATARTGKVVLQWKTPVQYAGDLSGYNVYRYAVDEVGESMDTIRVNTTLIHDTSYTDYAVVPGMCYNYMFTGVRTDQTETNPSSVVSVVPLTATLGDANGDLTVDMEDVNATVGYITNQNSWPFIFDAADVNADDTINVMDVVGIVDIILPSDSDTFAGAKAIYSLENGIFYVNCAEQLGGIQFTVHVNKSNAGYLQPLTALDGMELTSAWLSDDEFLFLSYSLSGKCMPRGKTPLMYVRDALVTDITISDAKGGTVLAEDLVTGTVSERLGNKVLAYPNPCINELHIPYTVTQNKETMVEIEFTDFMGRIVDRKTVSVSGAGNYEYVWHPAARIADGMYLYSLRINGQRVVSEKMTLSRNLE